MEKRFFLLFDSVHNFKNIYNNFLTRGSFQCPDFGEQKIGQPLFIHLKQLYDLECGKTIKMAYLLTDKVLNPSSIEKTNVKLADALFHESTIGALEYYSHNGYPQFSDTVPFLNLIRKYWNIVNVKSQYFSQQKNDPWREPITDEQSPSLVFLLNFKKWLEQWQAHSNAKNKLTFQTFTAVKQSTQALVELAQHLISQEGFQYVLLGQLQSDPLEQRFGWYRQMSGANYFVSVRQILEAEKAIRVRSLIKFTGLSSFLSVKQTLQECGDESNQLENEIDQLLDVVALNENLYECSDKNDANIIYYIAGFIAYSQRKHLKCEGCCNLLIASLLEPKVKFNHDMSDSADEERKKMFLELLNRGRLCHPSDLVFLACIFIWNFYQAVTENNDSKDSLLSSTRPKEIFCKAVCIVFEDYECYLDLCETCCNGHKFKDMLLSVAGRMFNILIKGFMAQMKEEARKRKCSSSNNSRKIAKLQSK